MNIGSVIKANRIRVGLSQEELAEMCQVSRQAIAKWECDASVPTLEKLIMIADIFRVSLDELTGRKSDDLLFCEFLKRYIPRDLKFGENDEVLPVIIRFLTFAKNHGVSADESVSGMKQVFLGTEECDTKV